MLSASQLLRLFLLVLPATIPALRAAPYAYSVSVNPTSVAVNGSVSIRVDVSISSNETWLGGAAIVLGTPPGGSEQSLGTISSSVFGGANYAFFQYSPNTPGTWKFRAFIGGDYTTSGGGYYSVDETPTGYCNLIVGGTPNTPPELGTLIVSNPTPLPSQSVHFSVDASDANGTISSVKFIDYWTGSTMGTDTAAPYECTIPSQTVGTLRGIYARATDNNGAVVNGPRIDIRWRNAAPDYLAERWTDINNDGVLDFIQDVMLNNKTQARYQSYLYGEPDEGMTGNGALMFYDVYYQRHCSYSNLSYLFNWLPWSTQGLFGDRFSWSFSWYTPYLTDCSYTIYDLNGRFQLYDVEAGRKYQLQTKQSVSGGSWSNEGAPLVPTSSTSYLTKIFGDWHGVSQVPDLFRVSVLGAEFGAIDYNLNAAVGLPSDVDNDGFTDYKRGVQPIVRSTTVVGAIGRAVKKVFNIEIPTGVIVNPTGSGNIVEVRVQSIADIVYEKTVQYVLTGGVTAPWTIQIAGLSDSDIAIDLLFLSQPEGGAFFFRAGACSAFDSEAEVGGEVRAAGMVPLGATREYEVNIPEDDLDDLENDGYQLRLQPSNSRISINSSSLEAGINGFQITGNQAGSANLQLQAFDPMGAKPIVNLEEILIDIKDAKHVIMDYYLISTPSDDPVWHNQVNEGAISDVINFTWRDQANVHVDVNLKGAKSFAFDDNSNGRFDLAVSIDINSGTASNLGESAHYLANAPGQAGHYTVYYGNAPLYNAQTGELGAGLAFSGAEVSQYFPYAWVDNVLGNVAAVANVDAYVIAHELGHMMMAYRIDHHNRDNLFLMTEETADVGCKLTYQDWNSANPD